MAKNVIGFLPIRFLICGCSLRIFFVLMRCGSDSLENLKLLGFMGAKVSSILGIIVRESIFFAPYEENHIYKWVLLNRSESSQYKSRIKD